MLYKVCSGADIAKLPIHISQAVRDEIKRVANIFDENYNCNNIDGGYILLAENIDDVLEIIHEHFDFSLNTFELADVITCDNGTDYVSVLYLLATEYAIQLLLPVSLTPTAITDNIGVEGDDIFESR